MGIQHTQTSLSCVPRNITPASPSLLQIAAFLHLRKCCEVLKRFGFRRKMYYLCHTKEERAQNTRVLSSSLGKNLTYKGCFTSDVEKNTSEINFFLGFIVEFFRQVVVIMSDVEPQKVKRYLFWQGADLTFRGSTRVDF